MRGIRRTGRLVAALAVAASVAGVVVLGADYPASRLQLFAGTAWLASTQTGQITLVDGASAEVAARVRVAAPGSPVRVVQQGSAAYVLNRVTGSLVRVDGATHRVSRAVTPISSAPDTLLIAAAPHAVYTVDTRSGLLAAADLKTLMPRGRPQRLVATDGLAIDGHGQPWAAARRAGELVWLPEGQRRTRAMPGALRLTMTKGQPAVVNVARGTAELLDPDTGAMVRLARPAIRRGDTVAVSGSPDRSRVLLAAGNGFVQCAFDSGSCTRPLMIGPPGSEFGAPVEVGNRAVVPNYATGQAAIIDLATMRLVAQRQLFNHPGRFELLVRDGFVFFNDPNSNRAGVLDLNGNVRFITKYDPTNPDNAFTPIPDPTPEADARFDQDPINTGRGDAEVKPGPGIPDPSSGRPWTSSPDQEGPPAPTLGMSIVVVPGNHGLVGEEFKLTLISRLNAGIAQVRWRFGDSAELPAVTGTTVRHRWGRSGTFVVSAAATFTTGVQAPVAETTMVIDPLGTPPRIEHLNIHRPRPVIRETVHFSAEIAGSQPERWEWTIDDTDHPGHEITVTTPEFQHVFIAAGTYKITLTVKVANLVSTSSKDLAIALGNVRSWGTNLSGESSVPPQAASGVVAVAGGSVHSLALKVDGSVIGWGDNSSGLVSIPPQARGVVAIAAAQRHSLALRADGSVVGWGNGAPEQPEAVPPEARTGVVAIDAGRLHSLALKANGSVIGWGGNQFGQISVPPEAWSGVVAIAAGSDEFSLALKADGSVIGWGNNRLGNLSIPPEAKSGVVAIAAGGLFSLALKSNGSVIGWGNFSDGIWSVPPEARSGVVAIAAGGGHGLALKADGSLIAWGSDRWGQVSMPPEARSGVTTIACGDIFSVVA